MTRLMTVIGAAMIAATPALADFETRASADDVATTMDRLAAAVEEALGNLTGAAAGE